MNCRLRTYDMSPPGGFPFENFKGIYRKFESQPLIEAQAIAVSAFRMGNGLPRSSMAECLRDIDRYTCYRLGCDSRFCVPVDSKSPATTALNQSSPLLTPGCRGCGARLH